MAEHSSTDALPRAITACSRCRSRKTRCDRKFPKCTACEKANVDCSALDPATGRNVPRSYVSHLEERVAALEQEVAMLRLGATSISADTGTPRRANVLAADSPLASSTHGTPLSPRSTRSDADSAVAGDKALSFAKMMFSAVQSPDTSSLETPTRSQSSPAGLPPYAEMQALLHVYMNHAYPQVPILPLERVLHFMQQTYFPRDGGSPTAEERASAYYVHIVAAIAYAKDPAEPRAEQQHAAALLYLPLLLKSGSRLSSLEAILLLTVYGQNRQSTPGIWYTLGIGSRLITDLSLESQTRETDTVELERRLFWSWYVLDRQICVYLSRPVGISDNVIHCPLPQLEPVPLAFCKLRILQSEIQRVLHHSDTLPREYASLEQWRASLDFRLGQWNASRPHTQADARSTFNLLFLALNYEQARLLLHGFSANLAITTAEVLRSAEAIVEMYSLLWRQDSVNFIWLAIHNIHIAASSYTYALLNLAPPQEDGSRKRTEEIAGDMQRMAARVEDMFTGMSARCPAALEILDTFRHLVRDARSKLDVAAASGVDTGAVDVHQHAAATAAGAQPGLEPEEMGDAEFMELISGTSRNPLWQDFFAGDEFMFGQA